MKVGVLALQGAFRAHADVLDDLAVDAVLVRSPGDLVALDALVLPGGESTTIAHLLRTSGSLEPLRTLLTSGLPVLATCAGLITVAAEVHDGRTDQLALGALDVAVRRNGYGRQAASFEAPVTVPDLPGGPFPGIFIRAPRIEAVGPDVEVLAEHRGDPVLVRQGRVWGAVFHPELSGDLRLHQLFLATAYDPALDTKGKGDA